MKSQISITKQKVIVKCPHCCKPLDSIDKHRFSDTQIKYFENGDCYVRIAFFFATNKNAQEVNDYLDAEQKVINNIHINFGSMVNFYAQLEKLAKAVEKL